MPVDLGKYIGVPYIHKGRSLKGLDCWGLVKMIYSDLGHKIKDLDDYEFEGNKKGHNYFTHRDEWIKRNIPHPYDVALFLDTKGIAYHAAVVTPDMKLIQATDRIGVSIVPLNRMLNLIKLDGYYHLKI